MLAFTVLITLDVWDWGADPVAIRALARDWLGTRLVAALAALGPSAAGGLLPQPLVGPLPVSPVLVIGLEKQRSIRNDQQERGGN
jgi:hypothetical protein